MKAAEERGDAVIETTLLVPVVFVVLMFVVFVGRVAGTHNDVAAAARDAARAASIRAIPDRAAADAATVASDALADRTIGCADLIVDVDTTDFGPGGTVSVDLACRVDLGDLTGLGLPGSRTVTATATAVIDRWQGAAP